MKFGPLAKNIAIEFITNEEEQQAILLPADYRPADTHYEVVKVSEDGASEHCTEEWNSGELLVVEAHMIRQFDFKERIYYTIAENHVVGWFYDDTAGD